MTTTPRDERTVDLRRHERIYGRLLVAYPREFRDEYRDDLVQAMRDIFAFSTDHQGVWGRVLRDLVASATRQRAAALRGGRRPSTTTLILLATVVVAAFIMGPGPTLPLILIPTVIMIGLPGYGLVRLRRAWISRRSTGGPVARHIAMGIASFLPTAVTLAMLGRDSGYLIFVSVGLAAITSACLGIIWAVANLVTSRSRPERRRRRPLLVLVPSIAVLAFIIGASYNSYRNSLGPPGDHSVANASADTRALWHASNTGNVEEVTRLTTHTCADPWVKFPYGNGRHNAKGQAETKELQLPENLDPPYEEISNILGNYMDTWTDRCPQPQ